MTVRGPSRSSLAWLPVALLVGVANGLIFLGFEWVVKHGTDWIWNDVAGTDDARWRVVPLAIGLSLVLSAVLRAVATARWVEPHLDPLAQPADEAEAPTVNALATILLIGAVSLLAGASLGPEASLVAVAAGIGALAAGRPGLATHPQVLVLASVGALLVAFFGSLIPIAVPLLLLLKRSGKLEPPAVLTIVLAGVAAWGTLWLVQNNDHGFGGIPAATVHARDYLSALLLGAVAAGIGALLGWVIQQLSALTRQIDERTSWWLAAVIFGAVLGVLYLVGGPTTQFSGSQGSGLLLSGEYHYGAWALVGLALVKVVATGWSLTSGYRGGLIFPAVFAAVALSVAAAEAFPDLAGPGVLLGSLAGLFVEMTSPALGVVVLLALLPAKLLPLGLVGAAGALGGRAAVTRVWAAR